MRGTRFGRLVVEEDSGKRLHKKKVWICLCDCGSRAEIITGQLTSGRTRSCGCLRKETCSSLGKENRVEVGGYRTKEHPLFSTWQGMKQRCLNQKHTHYNLYGGRVLQFVRNG